MMPSKAVPRTYGILLSVTLMLISAQAFAQHGVTPSVQCERTSGDIATLTTEVPPGLHEADIERTQWASKTTGGWSNEYVSGVSTTYQATVRAGLEAQGRVRFQTRDGWTDWSEAATCSLHPQPDLTQQQLDAMEPVLESVITLEGHRLFGASVVQPRPFPRQPDLCWACNQCVEPDPPPMIPPDLLPDCPKPGDLDELYDEWAYWAAVTQVLTNLLDAYNWYDYWSGVANMVQDMTKAAGLLLPGAGSVAAKGLNMILQMAADGVMDAMMDDLLEASGLSDFNSRGALTKGLNDANTLRLAAHQAYMAELIPWIECQNNVNEENIERQADLDAWNKVKDQYLEDWQTYQDCLDDPNRCKQEECQ